MLQDVERLLVTEVDANRVQWGLRSRSSCEPHSGDHHTPVPRWLADSVTATGLTAAKDVSVARAAKCHGAVMKGGTLVQEGLRVMDCSPARSS